MSRKPLSEQLGRWAFWLIFTGMNVTFFVMHLTGLMGMPRRVYTYPDIGWTAPNFVSTVGAFILAAGVLVIVIDMIRNFRFSTGESAGNVFGAGTLEWLPTHLYSARSIPVVTSRYPLWDDPNLGKKVEQGRYFLPNAATGERETIITSPIKAEPQYLQRMPGPSWFHFGAAVTTAGFFLLLTVKLYWIAILSGLAAIACIVRWVWDNDLPMKHETADIGAGISVPAYASGPRSHGWWAMIVLLTVTGMIFAMLLFSYIFLWSRNAGTWPQPPAIGSFVAAALLCAAAAVAGFLAACIYARRVTGALVLVLLAAAALLTAWGVRVTAWRAHGLRPELSSHDALVATFLSWDAVFVAVVAMMALYALARRFAGLLAPERAMTMQCISLFTIYTAAQALIALFITRIFPLTV